MSRKDKIKDELKPNPSAARTAKYTRTNFRALELQKQNRLADRRTQFWTGSQLLLHHHSTLGLVRRALERHIICWIEADFNPITRINSGRGKAPRPLH